jgi:predicted phosphodiesterase
VGKRAFLFPLFLGIIKGYEKFIPAGFSLMASDSFFPDMLDSRFNPQMALDLSKCGKFLIISDFHMGGGWGDDLEYNGGLLCALLEQHYLAGGWHLILNGDIEELQKYSLEDIRFRWQNLYRIFDLFAAQNRFCKVLGNHDETLAFEKDYPYPLYNAVRVETAFIPMYIYHGHQASRIYTNFNHLLRLSARYFLRPFGIHNISSSRNPYRRFYVEKQAYAFSLRNNCISIIGHTHRPLFESLGRFDYIKFEIERLCRDYPDALPAEQERIREEVRALRSDLGKLKRSERRDVLRQSLYGDEIPVPCLFNSGCAIGKMGVYALEVDRETISLVYWFTEGAARKFINRGWYPIEELPGTRYRRVVLNRDRLDYIQARIELLGN